MQDYNQEQQSLIDNNPDFKIYHEVSKRLEGEINRDSNACHIFIAGTQQSFVDDTGLPKTGMGVVAQVTGNEEHLMLMLMKTLRENETLANMITRVGFAYILDKNGVSTDRFLEVMDIVERLSKRSDD